MHRYGALLVLISTALCAQEALNEGIAAFKNAHYREAVELFQKAVDLQPNDAKPHLYLATAYMSQWIPGADSPENNAYARSAETEFKRVLELDGNDKTALASLGSLAYNEAVPLKGEEKVRKLDEAMDWNQRLAAVDPTNKEAPYTMGVIAWTKWYPVLMTARAKQQMRPEDPGPLAEPARQELKAQYGSILEDGLANLDRALRLDPNYSDAMAYLNLLIRERADLRDTKEEYAADVAVADEWVQKSLEAKRAQAQSGMVPPPAPPSYGGGGGGGARTPTRIRVGGDVQALNLVTKVDALYPPLAGQAHISGQVRFSVIIAKDGTVQNVQLISGHPLLVAAARDAVSRYVYKPALLNGNPVEVITEVKVDFSPGN